MLIHLLLIKSGAFEQKIYFLSPEVKKMSKGEDRIVDLLKKEKITFVREKSFHDLKHGLFRYDFYLPYLDGGPAIIEYNGEQHYEFVKKFYKTRRDL
jgi:hypothetical protein